MIRILTLSIAIFVVGLSTGTYAQDAGQKAQELTAALDKTKYKKKENKYVTVEVYVDIKNTPVVKSSTADYSGLYETDDDNYLLDLKVNPDGSAEGKGHDQIDVDNSARWNFILKDARVDGAMLIATKVYANGTTEKFEAVFADRTVSVGKNKESISTRDVSFGIGFIRKGEDWQNRIFLEKQ